MLILLVLVAVAVVLFLAGAVAANDDELLAEVAPDRADLVLPSGRLAAEDVAGVRFGLALRGYRMAEVDTTLDRVQSALAERDARIGELEAVLADIVAPVVREAEEQAAGRATPQPGTPELPVAPAAAAATATEPEPSGAAATAPAALADLLGVRATTTVPLTGATGSEAPPAEPSVAAPEATAPSVVAPEATVPSVVAPEATVPEPGPEPGPLPQPEPVPAPEPVPPTPTPPVPPSPAPPPGPEPEPLPQPGPLPRPEPLPIPHPLDVSAPVTPADVPPSSAGWIPAGEAGTPADDLAFPEVAPPEAAPADLPEAQLPEAEQPEQPYGTQPPQNPDDLPRPGGGSAP